MRMTICVVSVCPILECLDIDIASGKERVPVVYWVRGFSITIQL